LPLMPENVERGCEMATFQTPLLQQSQSHQ